jgi:CRP-like cAMP-binding protein
MDPKVNQLIAALEQPLFQQWLGRLEAVDMPLGLVLYEPGRELGHVYFPTTSIVSLKHILKDGSSTEVAVVGKDGAVGVSLVIGGKPLNSRAVVHRSGHGFRLPRAALADLVDPGDGVTHLLLRYTQALITQMAQTAVCNRHHRADQQLCRRLLLILDRLVTDHPTTRDTDTDTDTDTDIDIDIDIDMFGGHRHEVTQAAQALESAGLIRYTPVGHIGVVDRPGLESRCCECYAVVKREYQRLLPAGVAR